MIGASSIYWNGSGFLYRRKQEIIQYKVDEGESLKYSAPPPLVLEKVAENSFFLRNASEILKVSNNEIEPVITALPLVPKQVKLIAQPMAFLRMCSDEEHDVWNLCAYEFGTQKKWSMVPCEHCFILNAGNYLLVHYVNTKELSYIDKANGKALWQLDLSDRGMLTDSSTGEVLHKQIQFLEVHDDLIVVQMGNGYLGAYHITDGSMQWERMMGYSYSYMKVADGQVYFLYNAHYGNRFSVYHLYTGELLYEQPFKNEILQNESFFTKPFLSDQYFMITGHYRKHIFFFNRQTARLDFSVDLNPYTHTSFGSENAPQLHGNYLYQLDNDGQLMVFEQK